MSLSALNNDDETRDLCVDDETDDGRSDKATNAAHAIGHSHHAARVIRRNVYVIHLHDETIPVANAAAAAAAANNDNNLLLIFKIIN